MNRKEFLELSKAIIGGFVIHEGLGQVAQAQSPADQPSSEARDNFYLERGLTGMARARGWFDAHWGAAVLAGYYLCQETQLGDDTIVAIKKQLDTLINLRASQFANWPDERSNAALIEEVPKALVPAMKGGLRAHGHAVIFASLSTRALRDAPQMARPKLIQSLCGLSRQIARKSPQKPDGDTFYYPSTQVMLDATFDSLVRFRQLLGRPSVRRPNFTHMVTHTEALLNLELMGYQDLTIAGHVGHQAHIAAPLPDFDPANHPEVQQRAKLKDLMSTSFWSDEQNVARWTKAWRESSNPNGYWVAFGHLFKVLYSYHRLIERIEDEEKVRLCGMILLERYLNPDVRGG